MSCVAVIRIHCGTVNTSHNVADKALAIDSVLEVSLQAR